VNYLAKVFITPKVTILDPAGKAVANSLHAMGYEAVQDVRLGKYVEIRLSGDTRDAVEQAVDAMCKRLLANDVIEDFHFQIGDAEP